MDAKHRNVCQKMREEGLLKDKERLPCRLAELNTSKVEITFSGSGDSGQIDSISYVSVDDQSTAFSPGGEKIVWANSTTRYDKDAVRKDDKGNPITSSDGTPLKGDWIKTSKDEETTLDAAVEDFIYRLLESTGHDWYNNEGGQGEVSIEVTENEINLNIGINEIITHEETYQL